MTDTATPTTGVHITQEQVLEVHAQFGKLDWHMVKTAMGPNWPAEWEALGPGQGIFESEEDRTP